MMKKLEMIRAFAELDGVKIYELCGGLFYSEYNGAGCAYENRRAYNPITDLAINCAARDKYEVEIEYEISLVKLDECILKSKGLWAE